MPPKAKITKEMVIDAGLKIVRTEGEENLNVRRVATELNCSTQPVMYHFKSVNDLKSAVYGLADEFHTHFIMIPDENAGNPLLSIGLRYIRFAYEEKNLFCFLFQSDKFKNISFRELVYSDYSAPIIEPICENTGLSESQAKELFESLLICVHGAASLIANNSIDYDNAYFERLLENTFMGMMGIIKGGKNETV